MRQKSADAIVVTLRDEGLNTEQGRSLYELAKHEEAER
jgi:hypothetical protein